MLYGWCCVSIHARQDSILGHALYESGPGREAATVGSPMTIAMLERMLGVVLYIVNWCCCGSKSAWYNSLLYAVVVILLRWDLFPQAVVA